VVDINGIGDRDVTGIYGEFYQYSNGGSPQTYGVQWSGILWVLLFFVVLMATIGVLIRSYRTNSTALYPLERFGPVTERASGLGLAFIVILIGQIAWGLYLTVVHILNGQHY
jgi:hypothetical protein